MKKLIEDMRNASAQAVGGTAFLDRHTLELAANQIEQMQSHLESLEKDAARWRELLTNDFFVVCTSELDEIFKSKLERVIDTARQSTSKGGD